MKSLSAVAAVVLPAALSVAPALAAANTLSIDFEKNWSGENGDIVRYYDGGRDGDPRDTSDGPRLGVSFVNVSGLSNSAATPGFPFYRNAPSPLGTAYANGLGSAFMNVAGGLTNALRFYYSTPAASVGAVRAYSGLDGTGTLLGTVDLVANDFGVGADGSPLYDTFSLATLRFGGVARSFDFTRSAAAGVLFDDVASVPEPGVALTMAAGGLAMLAARRRRAR